jgi:hypothetical protein
VRRHRGGAAAAAQLAKHQQQAAIDAAYIDLADIRHLYYSVFGFHRDG